MPRKLKVFRTPTGFHDAYVAAPSRKAALEAWGAATDLFARGSAEEITDARLMAEPLKHPGEVIRVSRGDLQAQLKALGPRKAAGRPGANPAPDKKTKRAAPPRRDNVDRAEAALAQARARQAREIAALDKEREAIERKLNAVKARQAKAISALEDRLDKAKAAYRAALDKWSD
jgi:hypothetical protein